MKKLFALLLAMMMVFTLAACGGGNDKPDPSGSGNTDPAASQQDVPGDASGTASGDEELTKLEKAELAFAQFGIDMDDIVADVEGEIPSSAFASVKVVEPLSYSALARWVLKPATPPTDEEKAAYREQVYNALKAAADDGELYYTSASQTGQTIPLDDFFGGCYYKYKDCKLTVSSGYGLYSVEIYYEGPWDIN